MTETDQVRDAIRRLLDAQKLAVLSTHERGHPYASLVAFANSTDLTRLLVATPETTRKFANLTADPRVAMLVDSRTHRDTDFHQALAVTAIGTAAVTSPDAAGELLAVYLDRHPYLDAFTAAPTTRIVEIRVRRYLLVERFQSVTELVITP